MYLLLCIFSSVMAVLALSSWAAKQGNGFATDEVTGTIIGIGDYRRALVQAGAAAIGIVIALLLSCVDYRSLVKVWPVCSFGTPVCAEMTSTMLRFGLPM